MYVRERGREGGVEVREGKIGRSGGRLGADVREREKRSCFSINRGI